MERSRLFFVIGDDSAAYQCLAEMLDPAFVREWDCVVWRGTGSTSIGAGELREVTGDLRSAIARENPAVICTTELPSWQALFDYLKLGNGGPRIIGLHLQPRKIGKSLLAKWFFNHLISVNLFRDAAAKSTSGHDGFLGLKNPVILDQPSLGNHAAAKMLTHTLRSLLFPNRVEFDGRQVIDHSTIALTYVTHFYCNQSNIDSVTSLLNHYAGYSPELLSRIQFVIVDDGSPVQYEIPDYPLNLLWLKIDQDIPWNQAGARNLGVTYARSDTVLMTDLDHCFSESSLTRIVARPPCGKKLYKVYRENQETGEVYAAHSNLFLMSRGRFMELFGYDEEFSGGYGAEDFRFVKYQKVMGTRQAYLPRSILCYERQVNRTRSYHSLVRDLSFNTGKDARKRLEINRHGHGAGHSRTFLNFTWRILKEATLPCSASRPVDRGWRLRAFLRQILPRF